MNEFLEALSKQFSEETLTKAQKLLGEITKIVTENGEEGLIAGNLYYQLMSDELESYLEEQEESETDE